MWVGLAEPGDRLAEEDIPFGREIDVLVSEDEDIAGALADAGVVRGASGGKAAHDLKVMRDGNARGTGEATLENGLVVRCGNKRPIHGQKSKISNGSAEWTTGVLRTAAAMGLTVANRENRGEQETGS
jgi:hypothetical protein